MDLELGIVTDNVNVINKTMSDTKTIPITFKRSDDIKQPSIIIKLSNYDKNYNYAYISLFKRYYFVNRGEAINNDYIQLNLTTDVLETFKATILNSTATIIEKDTPSYLNSSVSNSVQTDKDIYQSNITLPDTKSTILSTIGG